MQKRAGLGLVAGLAIIVAACGGAATPAPTAAPTAAPTTAATAAPTEAPTEAPTAAPPTSDLKIGVVTDIGTLDDKNYNEYSYKGAQAGAAAIGAANPPAVVPKDPGEYAAKIDAFVKQGFDVVVTVGFNLGGATTAAAKANPDTWFVGFDQSPVCVDETGAPDPTFTCKGDAATLLPKYVTLDFAEDQAGYLAGIIAGSVSKTGVIGAIGGTSLCVPCIQYIQGYELGAKSVNPDIKVVSSYVTADFSEKAFNDPVGGKTYAKTFIDTNKPDVLFQVAGKTGNGVLDAACEAGIYGVGVDVDQALSYPAASKCLVTSAEKKLVLAISSVIQQIDAGSAKGGDVLFDAKNDGIGSSPGHDLAALITPEIQAKVDAAMAAMKAGTLVTCPTDSCGKLK